MIHFVIGTRAQLLKLAPVMLACRSQDLKWRWVYTAQHRETIHQTLETFGLPPPGHVIVKWETEAESLGKMSHWLLQMVWSLPRSRRILGDDTGSRDIVVTHGDTFTTWLAALMGKVAKTPVMHVESGLRSFDLLRPFPEELNRLLTFRLADYYAAPGEQELRNLRKYRGEKLNTGGNTQIDTLRFGLEHSDAADISLPEEPFIVISVHRYANIFRPERLETIVGHIERVARQFRVLFVQHPTTKRQLEKLGHRRRLEQSDRITLLPRLEYLPFIKAVRRSEFVVTDGGGNQEELSYLGKPTIIFRDETERSEGLGESAVLSKLDSALIDEFTRNYKSFERAPRLPSHSPSQTIAAFLAARGFGA